MPELRSRSRSAAISSLLDQIRSGRLLDWVDTVDQLLERLIGNLPADLRGTPIDAVGWSEAFATNPRWRKIWNSLGVATLGDLAQAGRALAQAPGVGRTKLLSLLRDLDRFAKRRPPLRASELRPDAALAVVGRTLRQIESGSPAPRAHVLQSLYQALDALLPPEVRALDLRTVPWTSEWLYTTSVWRTLGISSVGQIPGAVVAMSRIRGIGKRKVLILAHELIDLSPELHATIMGRRALKPRAGGRPSDRRSNQQAAASSLVAAIDRLADRLSDRERDVLRRRIGWSYPFPAEKLRTLAGDHGVTNERIRQIEQQIRTRLVRLLRARKVAERLRSKLTLLGSPVTLEALIASDPHELANLHIAWRPLASLLASEGGPYFDQDPAHSGAILVSLRPSLCVKVRPAARPAKPAGTGSRRKATATAQRLGC